jgi:hypothetical protein
MTKADNNNTPTETATLVAEVVRKEEIAPTEKKPVEWVHLSTAQDMRAHIFNATDILEEIVDVPEWQVHILVMGMTGKERGRVLKASTNPDNTVNIEIMYAKMCIATCHHPETREKIFGDADIETLNSKAGGILERLALVASRLSGLGEGQNNAILKN